jgi:hypothetical protein
VRPTCFSEELRAGLERFAAGARDASPRPPELPPAAGASSARRSH